MSDLLSIADLCPRAPSPKSSRLSERTDLGAPLAGKGVALVFQKPSARTRNSIEMAVVQLGAPSGLHPEGGGRPRHPRERRGRRPHARLLSCDHRRAGDGPSRPRARWRRRPRRRSLNLLSDTDHPLQALADLLTVKQLLGRLEGARIAYVGDADNNVARSLAQACVAVGAELTLRQPRGLCARATRPTASATSSIRPRRSTARRSSTPTSGSRWARTTRPRRGARRFAALSGRRGADGQSRTTPSSSTASPPAAARR